jgi:hypothetical protein
MEGFEAITFGDEKAGTVVGREGQFLIVEHGAIFKHRRPVPDTFATVDEEAGVVRLTVSKDILESAPEVKESVDERAAAEHYGLAEGFTAPETEGYGLLEADDPAFSAEREGADHGVEPAAERRAAALGRLAAGQGANDGGPPSPAVTGGDRRRDQADRA